MVQKKPTVPAGGKGNPSLGDEQVKKYLPMVRAIARRIATKLPRHYDLEDLVSDGMMGLLAAYDRFDPERGVKFETFATYYIKGAILDNLPKLPTMPKGKQPSAEEASPDDGEYAGGYESELGDDPEADAALLVNKITQLTYSYILSLDAPSGSDGEEGFSLLNQLGTSDRIQHEMELEELQQLLRLTIEQLPNQERTTLRLYYFHNMSFNEIGQKLGLSESWVSRIHRRALEQLRQKLGKRKSLDDFISW
ncbi:MAG: sigma-70 family RNA polymerase sigma factor [Cyanobacteria bacterium NC_groundwater_1444_Ag_S-0.65um_54_12]|nr:sigma-70 family RNA polymerase sigma factor [Cyanobacteria bacterium NC_groundwater_1444_Ag_S-0.65um_54_12]